MSAWELTDTATTKPDASSELRPRLLGLPGGRGGTLGNLAFAGAVVGLLAGGMIGLLALNVTIQDEQLQLNKDNRRAAALALELSDKQARAYEEAAPGSLAARAAGLGMVPNVYPAYIDLRTGKILGSPRPVTGREMPGLAVPTTIAAAAGTSSTVQTNVQSWFDAPGAAPTAATQTQPSPAPATTPAKPTATKTTAKPTATKTTAKPTATKTTAKPTATTTTTTKR